MTFATSAVHGSTLADRIDAILPQTQCRKCSYAGCKPYAQAIANGEADINQCPPGGAKGIRKLADLLGREVKPLSADHGVEKPRAVATIDEPACIGCTLCIQACPVDAIIGAAKQTHTIIADQCTGCELCLPPCPTDCISMIPTGGDAFGSDEAERKTADESRERFMFRQLREERDKQDRADKLNAKARLAHDRATAPVNGTLAANEAEATAAQHAALIAAALARVRQRDTSNQPGDS